MGASQVCSHHILPNSLLAPSLMAENATGSQCVPRSLWQRPPNGDTHMHFSPGPPHTQQGSSYRKQRPPPNLNHQGQHPTYPQVQWERDAGPALTYHHHSTLAPWRRDEGHGCVLRTRGLAKVLLQIKAPLCPGASWFGEHLPSR